METDGDYRMVLVTAPDMEVGRAVARKVLEEKLVACVNIVPKIESLYWWEGKIDSSSEALLVMKTLAVHAVELEQVVVAAHPYDTPEFVALPITEGSQKYLSWISDSTRPTAD